MLLISGYVSAQTDTVIYYSMISNPVSSKKEASYYDDLTKVSENQFIITRFQNWNGKWKEYFKTRVVANSDTSLLMISMQDRLKPDTTIRCFHRVDSGFLIVELKNSVVISKGMSKRSLPLVKTGIWKYYDNFSKKLDREESYINNQMTTNKIWINDSTYVNDVCQISDIMPEYKGGQKAMMSFMKSNLKYPETAAKNRIHGMVVVQVIITDSGQIKGAKIIKGVEESLNEEALRVVNLLPETWIPGKTGDKNVNVLMNIPVSFEM